MSEGLISDDDDEEDHPLSSSSFRTDIVKKPALTDGIDGISATAFKNPQSGNPSWHSWLPYVPGRTIVHTYKQGRPILL
ncbi:MAG: hypothetical protein NTY71_07855 [Methanoregula sp.]|jgi:hypothetical protein|nr:hypothetical protein [Methanoregula sp.]